MATSIALVWAVLASPAYAIDLNLYDWTGDGYATFSIDEFGAMQGCGATGAIFNPLGAIPAPTGTPVSWISGPYSGDYSQANCSSQVYLFDEAGTWRQSLRNNGWPYHPSFSTSHLNAPSIYARATDVLETTADVFSDTTFSTKRRVTEFAVAGYPDLEVELEQTVCGAVLYQE